MPYLSQVLGRTVLDSKGERIGTVSDLGASTAEIFPRVTSLAFRGPDKKPLMISWRKYVDAVDDDAITLNVPRADVRFSYLQDQEILLGRDLMGKQVVDLRETKVVRVTDLKLSSTSDGQLRLLGAEVGVRGRLRGVSPSLEAVAVKVAGALGKPVPEHVVAWSYMDPLDRSLSEGKPSVDHRSFEDMHPADIADVIEQLDPKVRSQVFRQLDTENAAETLSELTDEIQEDVIEGLPEQDVADMIAEMDPDDAADIIGELPYERSEKILNLMGAAEEKAIRALLGYSKNTAGGIMTSEFVALPQTADIAAVRRRLRALDVDFEPVYYIYTLDENRRLVGVLSMRDVVTADESSILADLSFNDLITVEPEDDQRSVIEEMTKYALVNMPVVDADGRLLGIVSVDDALDVIEEDQERGRELASGTRSESASGPAGTGRRLAWFMRRELWFLVWAALLAVGTHLVPAPLAPAFTALLPIVLLVADDIVGFAAGYLMDGEDETPGLAGLLVRDAGVGLAMGLAGWLVFTLASWAGSGQLAGMPVALEAALVSSMVVVAALVTLSALLTRLMAGRSGSDRPTPGILASIGIMLGAGLVFALIMVGLAQAMGVTW